MWEKEDLIGQLLQLRDIQKMMWLRVSVGKVHQIQERRLLMNIRCRNGEEYLVVINTTRHIIKFGAQEEDIA